MIADCPYPDRPAIYTPAQQSPPSEGYRIDWGALLRMNLPDKPPVACVEAKQVLTGKAAVADSLEKEFPLLVKQWKEETFFVSSSTKLFNHRAYVRIMSMGKDGLPLVLRELQKNSGRWFYALKFMAGEDGKNVAAGIKNYDDTRAAWLEWGYKNNYI